MLSYPYIIFRDLRTLKIGEFGGLGVCIYPGVWQVCFKLSKFAFELKAKMTKIKGNLQGRTEGEMSGYFFNHFS